MEPSHDLALAVNNDIYNSLGSRWYEADDDPIALLRAESRHRNPWVQDKLTAEFGPRSCDILDVGCGAGFLANYLADGGHRVSGLDLSPEALVVAAAHDSTGTVRYACGDAEQLPYAAETFDGVAAMDFLEHVEEPARVVAEVSRVLVPGGLFFFHTFNRNWLAWLIIIKGVEWFVRNTPKNLHILRLFRKPEELAQMFTDQRLEIVELRGSRPKLGWAFLRMLVTGRVPSDFAFTFTSSTKLAFTGVARKRSPVPQ